MSLDTNSTRQRYTYSYGYRTREQAERDLEDMFADGEISEGEFPLIERYTDTDGLMRFRITLAN